MEKIVILCGGKGVRLRPLTENVPKPLVPLNGKPILEYLMNMCSKQGFNEFVICTGYKPKMVEDAVKSFSKPEWEIKFVDSGEDSSMLKRIYDASRFCGERFLVCYGDTIADVDLKNLIKKHEADKADLTNVLYQMESPFGIMETAPSGKITKYLEKPLLPFWFNIGFFVFNKSALKEKHAAKDSDWVGFLNEKVSSGKMFAQKHSGAHITFNTEHEKTEAEKKIGTFSYVFN